MGENNMEKVNVVKFNTINTIKPAHAIAMPIFSKQKELFYPR